MAAVRGPARPRWGCKLHCRSACVLDRYAALPAMQYLLDFIQDHTFESQLYFVAQCPAGELEVLWQRAGSPEHWQLRLRPSQGPWELVARGELLCELESRGADMGAVRQDLNAMLAAQIAFADLVLRDANQQLGAELVQRFVLGNQSFLEKLRAAVEQLSTQERPRMEVLPGGGAQSALRAGHLTIVR